MKTDKFSTSGTGYTHGDSAARCTQMTSKGGGEDSALCYPTLLSGLGLVCRMPEPGFLRKECVSYSAAQAHELDIQHVHKPALMLLCSQISGGGTGRTAGTRTAIHRELNSETQNTLKKQNVVWLITIPPGGALLLGMAMLQQQLYGKGPSAPGKWSKFWIRSSLVQLFPGSKRKRG